MQRIINFFRGSVRLEVTGPFPERFLNLCAQDYLSFWDICWLPDGGLCLTVSRHCSRRARALGEKVGCSVTDAGEGGVPSFLRRFRRRYALLLGMAVSLAAVCVLSQFILFVEVSGNETVTTAEIVTALRRLGLGPGTYGPGVDESQVSRDLLLEIGELSWCAVNLHGTRAEVLVREAIPTPELPDESVLGDVVAQAGGIVSQVEVLSGEGAVEEGDTVLPGEVLISGTVVDPVPEYSELEPQTRQVRADGRVYARTWRTLTAQIPLTVEVKVYTGEEVSRFAGHILGLRVNFYGNSGIDLERYDKITKIWTMSLPTGETLPLSMSRETFRAYETAEAELDAEAAQTMLEQRLLETLKEQVGEGEIVSVDYTARVTDGVLTVALTAECQEEIGVFRPFGT